MKLSQSLTISSQECNIIQTRVPRCLMSKSWGSEVLTGWIWWKLKISFTYMLHELVEHAIFSHFNNLIALRIYIVPFDHLFLAYNYLSSGIYYLKVSSRTREIMKKWWSQVTPLFCIYMEMLILGIYCACTI